MSSPQPPAESSSAEPVQNQNSLLVCAKRTIVSVKDCLYEGVVKILELCINIAIITIVLVEEVAKVGQWILTLKIIQIWMDFFLQAVFLSILSVLIFNVSVVSSVAAFVGRNSEPGSSRNRAMTQLQKSSFDFLQNATGCVAFWMCGRDGSHSFSQAAATGGFLPLLREKLTAKALSKKHMDDAEKAKFDTEESLTEDEGEEVADMNDDSLNDEENSRLSSISNSSKLPKNQEEDGGSGLKDKNASKMLNEDPKDGMIDTTHLNQAKEIKILRNLIGVSDDKWNEKCNSIDLAKSAAAID